MAATTWLDSLNPAQRQAVDHDQGPLAVIAGAGTGKTKTLASRVARLVERGVPPERILLLTFTRRAAQEMLSRASRLIGADIGGKVWGGTFHSVANRLLRTYGESLGLPPSFTVIDQDDSVDLFNLVRSEAGLGERGRRFPRKDTLASIYSRLVNAQQPLRQVLKHDFPWCAAEADAIAEVFGAYIERKRAQHLLDFDDLLLFWHVAATDPGLGPILGDRFEHVLVDEYQDTNAIQAEIVRAMRATNHNVMVVGDDAQAIYSFRAADPDHILHFPDQFENTTLVVLEQNYRSTSAILAVSNDVIAKARRRYTKELFTARQGGPRPELVTCLDEQSQADAVCDAVLAHREEGIELREQAVLFRTGHHSDLLEVELGRRNIPFVKYGGLKFLEAAHVKDLLSLLRIVDNPYDEPAWFRTLTMLEGVGPANARRVMAAIGVRPRLAASDDDAHRSPLRRLAEVGDDAPPTIAAELAGLAAALNDCAAEPAPEASAQVDRLAEFLTPIIGRRYESPEVRLGDLEQLASVAEGYASRSRFVTELVLDPAAHTGDLAQPPHLDDDYLILSTVHSAKGGEWKAVHVIHAADGMFPSDMATRDADGVDEERRLFYVALTRAVDSLHVYFSLRYHHHRDRHDDSHGYAPITRFLPPATQALFDRRQVGVVAPEDDAPRPPLVTAAAGRVDAGVRALLGG